MAWDIEVVDECAVVRMNTNKVIVQNAGFFADLHGAFGPARVRVQPTAGRADGPGRCVLGRDRLPIGAGSGRVDLYRWVPLPAGRSRPPPCAPRRIGR
jgi:hypothetical protein